MRKANNNKPIKVRGSRGRRNVPLIVHSGPNTDILAVQPTRIIRQTITFNAKISADASGTIAHRFSLRNPLRAIDGASTYVNAVDWGKLFDAYRPIRLTAQFVPTFAIGFTPVGALIVATDFDHPDTLAPPNFSDILTYDNRRLLDAHDNSVVEVHIPTLSEGTLVSGGPATIMSKGFLDFANPPIEGDLFLSGINFPASSTPYLAILTMTIDLRYKRNA